MSLVSTISTFFLSKYLKRRFEKLLLETVNKNGGKNNVDDVKRAISAENLF